MLTLFLVILNKDGETYTGGYIPCSCTKDFTFIYTFLSPFSKRLLPWSSLHVGAALNITEKIGKVKIGNSLAHPETDRKSLANPIILKGRCR